MTVLHVFDQPLSITKPYEGYMGNLVLPRKVVETAAAHSLLVNFFTPRAKVLEAVRLAYPGIRNENIHVWTLRGKSRQHRIGKIWQEWQTLGVDLIDEGWELRAGTRYSPIRVPTRPRSGLAPGRTAPPRPTSFLWTAMPRRPKPCRRPACARSWISTYRSRSSPRPSS